MKKSIFLFNLFLISLFIGSFAFSQSPGKQTREHLLMDNNWRFAFGHSYDQEQDFNNATGYFSYITKTGYGDGAAAKNFDDRSWRELNLPHDWAVEQGFSALASHSHGYKTVGRKFPETSVGWYRKTFTIAESDTAKRISIQFDGIHRDSRVWINGFYLGNESSGYYDINYDLTPYLNYGGDNVIAVRVDVTMEEGWFYEGAGIYRHVWLTKTDRLHVGYNGTFISSEVNKSATLNVQTEIENEYNTAEDFVLQHYIIDDKGEKVASHTEGIRTIDANEKMTVNATVEVKKPRLWSLDDPYLYKVETILLKDGEPVDNYESTIGIRTITFNADKGFFLNGEHVKIKGTCNHQDHAGVGTAIPDALQKFRIKQLQGMGSNAYRCAHNPPTPELLDACDELGMLVMVENRLMSTAPEAKDRLARMIKRDRNHPSVIVWALGNEEWHVEGNITGKRISNELQTFAKKLDATRPYTVAASGGWGHGVDLGLDMIGFNYLRHGNADEHHENFPEQLCIGSEESNTQGTRGVYFDDLKNGHMAYVDRSPGGSRIEEGWKFYDERPWASGLFIWTGFDYRGEPNPLAFPAVNSQFGIMDMCGFPKEPYYYLKAWWGNEPFIKITPHWNWEGKEGDTIQVRVNANCEEVELFLNNSSLGKQVQEKNGLLNWFVVYKPGTLVAKGYVNGKLIVEDIVKTTQKASSIELIADRSTIKADGADVSVITIQVNDAENLMVPTSNNEISFSLSGPGKIIGVGNGDPASHETEVFIPEFTHLNLSNGKISVVKDELAQNEVVTDFDDSEWLVYRNKQQQMEYPADETVLVRVEFELDEVAEESSYTLYSKSLAMNQSIYLNGQLIAENIERDSKDQVFALDSKSLKVGKNVLAYKGTALVKRTRWEELNTNPGLIQIVSPAKTWKRKVFNGLAQVIVQSSGEVGEITLRASSSNLKSGEIKIEAVKTVVPPSIK